MQNFIDENPEKMWKSLKLPASPGTILKSFIKELTTYEQGEILGYHEIYYIGIGAKKTKPDPSSSSPNVGYDDERGDYNIVIGDHIAFRYEVIDVLGHGSFGQVLKVLDHKSGDEFALKIIRNKSRFHQQAAIEIEVLSYLKEKDPKESHAIVHIQDYFTFRKHICIAFELLSINLYEFIKSNKFKGLSMNLIRRFAVQILQALELLERLQIIHCDLKPENILLKESAHSALKVIDFGSACFTSKRVYTYIQSRFYRAPEIILGISYSNAIDM
mmetsp:Transcript_8230/g.8090  ORF Transcript_8230/g.8090 Transcript_8230/m.8090 type:complete len:273 (-) Transcript_8230:464-1282(-)